MRHKSQLSSGVVIDPLEPDPSVVRLADIAVALGNTCRFGGHIPRFYSVAEHCWHVRNLVEPAFRLHALLHDAAEAYLWDCVRPLKPSVYFDEGLPGATTSFKAMEARWLEAIYEAFEIDWPPPAVSQYVVRKADDVMCVTEGDVLFGHRADEAFWEHDLAGDPDVHLLFWTPENAAKNYRDVVQHALGREVE